MKCTLIKSTETNKNPQLQKSKWYLGAGNEAIEGGIILEPYEKAEDVRYVR